MSLWSNYFYFSKGTYLKPLPGIYPGTSTIIHKLDLFFQNLCDFKTGFDIVSLEFGKFTQIIITEQLQCRGAAFSPVLWELLDLTTLKVRLMISLATQLEAHY